MTRVHYSEVRKRFTHIDAELVGCRLGVGPEENFFAVRFYPWWEHPKYLEARDADLPWGFKNIAEDAAKTVTVYPVGLRELKLSELNVGSEITDWEFCTEHWTLAPFEDSITVFINAEPPREALRTLVMSDAHPDVVVPLLEHLCNDVHAPFAFGPLATGLWARCESLLEEQGCAYFVASPPRTLPLPKVLFVDEDNYLIADDFFVEIPDFEHRDAWFDANAR